MIRSTIVVVLTGLTLVLGGCSGKAKDAGSKEAEQAAASTKPNPWSSDAALDAAKAAEDAKAKKKPADKPAAKPSPNPWASDAVLEAAEAEKNAKDKKKQ